MAPKASQRKRTDEATGVEPSTSTRATRSSARTANSTQAGSDVAATKLAPAKKVATTQAVEAATVDVSKQNMAENAAEVPPSTKRPKTAKAAPQKIKSTTAKAKTTTVSSKAAVPADDELEGDVKAAKRSNHDDEPGPSKHVPVSEPASATTTPTTTKPIVVPKALPPPPFTKSEPYTPSRAQALFKVYADHDEPDVIGPEGFTQLCTDAQIPLDGALPLILAWQLGAKEMGKFSRDEWSNGTGSLQISSLTQLSLAVTELENLIILGKPPLKKPTASTTTPAAAKKKRSGDEPYDRTAYWAYVEDRKGAFQKLYAFCFALAKPEQARNIDMETATAFWSVLLVPQYTLMGEVIEFINEKGSYKGANKDLWNMMLEFCQTVKPTLQDYETDGAWPTLLDDFVSWKRSKSGSGETGPANPGDD